MPDLKELVAQREKKQFKKRSYRPWDLTGGGNLSENINASNLITPPCVDTTVIEIENQKNVTQINDLPPIFSSKSANTNQIQSEDKVRTNQGQSRDKVGTNQGQSEDKVGTNQGQKSGLKTETRDKVETKLRTELGTKWGQSEDKSFNLSPFSSLTGLQKKIVLFFYEDCKRSRSKITDNLSVEYLMEKFKTTKLSVKKTIQRLEKKKVIKRCGFKNGRGGWSKYELVGAIYQELLYAESQDKLGTKWGQTRDKVETELETELRTNPLSSSSVLNINKTTTTADDEKNFLPEEWLKIDTSPLEHIFFSTTQLRQLVDKNIPEVVQESINYFSYEISQEPEKYTKPLNVLMGVLRQGNAWASPKGYEAPKDKAQREYFERKKAENEKRNQFVSELMDLEFLDWQSALSDQELERIVPEDVRLSRLTAAKTSILKNYFKDQVLIPRLKTEGML